MAAPTGAKLDADQIIQTVFDPVNKALTVASVGGGTEVVADQGAPGTFDQPWFFQPSDSNNVQTFTSSGEGRVTVTLPLPTGTNSIGQVTANAGIGTFTVGGVVAANQGAAAAPVAGWPVKPTDGTNSQAYTASSEAKVSVTQPLPVGTNSVGQVTANAGSGTFTVAGTTTANQGTAANAAGGWTVKPTDGTNSQSYTASSEAKVSVTQPLPVGTNSIGQITANAGTGTFTVGGTLTANQGTSAAAAGGWTVKPTDGTNSQAYTASSEAKVSVTQPLPTGTNSVGQVTANAGSGTFTIAGTVAQGTAAAAAAGWTVKPTDGTNSQGYTASSEAKVSVTQPLPAGTNAIGTVALSYLSVVDFLDTPLLDASSTNITASAGNPVQVVASLAVSAKKLHIADTTGQFIGVYTGAALSEMLKLIINPGMDGEIEQPITAGARVSLRAMNNTAITSGNVCIQFLG